MGTRHVVAGVAITGFGLLLGGCGWGQDTYTEKDGIGQTIRSVRFDNDAGDVTIRTGDESSITRQVHYDGDKPGDTYRVDGDVLVIEDCPARNCWVNYEIVVPDGTEVSGHVDSGSVDLTGVAKANVQAESGDITMREVAGTVNATAQSGTIDLTSIGGAVVAGTESGDVTVGLSVDENVTARAESGSIEVTVPGDAYQVSATSDSGDVTNPLTGKGAHKIEAHTSSGDVTIKQS